MLAHHEYDTSEFAAGKAAAILEANRVQPQFGAIGIAFHVDVGRPRSDRRRRRSSDTAQPEGRWGISKSSQPRTSTL
jgi:hypothetical protein